MAYRPPVRIPFVPRAPGDAVVATRPRPIPADGIDGNPDVEGNARGVDPASVGLGTAQWGSMPQAAAPASANPMLDAYMLSGLPADQVPGLGTPATRPAQGSASGGGVTIQGEAVRVPDGMVGADLNPSGGASGGHDLNALIDATQRSNFTDNGGIGATVDGYRWDGASWQATPGASRAGPPTMTPAEMERMRQRGPRRPGSRVGFGGAGNGGVGMGVGAGGGAFAARDVGLGTEAMATTGRVHSGFQFRRPTLMDQARERPFDPAFPEGRRPDGSAVGTFNANTPVTPWNVKPGASTPPGPGGMLERPKDARVSPAGTGAAAPVLGATSSPASTVPGGVAPPPDELPHLNRGGRITMRDVGLGYNMGGRVGKSAGGASGDRASVNGYAGGGRVPYSWYRDNYFPDNVDDSGNSSGPISEDYWNRLSPNDQAHYLYQMGAGGSRDAALMDRFYAARGERPGYSRDRGLSMVLPEQGRNRMVDQSRAWTDPVTGIEYTDAENFTPQAQNTDTGFWGEYPWLSGILTVVGAGLASNAIMAAQAAAGGGAQAMADAAAQVAAQGGASAAEQESIFQTIANLQPSQIGEMASLTPDQLSSLGLSDSAGGAGMTAQDIGFNLNDTLNSLNGELGPSALPPEAQSELQASLSQFTPGERASFLQRLANDPMGTLRSAGGNLADWAQANPSALGRFALLLASGGGGQGGSIDQIPGTFDSGNPTGDVGLQPGGITKPGQNAADAYKPLNIDEVLGQSGGPSSANWQAARGQFQPITDALMSDATRDDSEANAGRAAADVESKFADAQRLAVQRAIQRGEDPTSEAARLRIGESNRLSTLDKAKASSFATNQARALERDKRANRLAAAAQVGLGYSGQAAQVDASNNANALAERRLRGDLTLGDMRLRETAADRAARLSDSSADRDLRRTGLQYQDRWNASNNDLHRQEINAGIQAGNYNRNRQDSIDHGRGVAGVVSTARDLYGLGSSIFGWKDGGRIEAETEVGLGSAPKKRKRRDYRNGGKVEGPGSPTSDSIRARLSDGEGVLNAEAMELLDEQDPAFLEQLNEQGLAIRKVRKALDAGLEDLQ